MALQSFLIFLCTLHGIFASPLLGETVVTPVEETTAVPMGYDPCDQFLDEVDAYLGMDSMAADFNGGKPTVSMVLTKIIPDLVFGMEEVNKTDVMEAAEELFCKDIELQYFLNDKMRSIQRKISKIWRGGNAGENFKIIKEIGVELSESMEMLANMVNETEEYYTQEMKSLYKTATLVGPQVKKTIKAVHKIENEAANIRFALKSLAGTTIRRCKKILGAIEKLLTNETPRETDMTKMLRYTAKLLDISHIKLGESILSYQTMKMELVGLVVDLKSYEDNLEKVQNDAKKEYDEKTKKAYIEMILGGVTSVAGLAFGVSGALDGVVGFSDFLGPAAAIRGVVNTYAAVSGKDALDEYYSSMSAELRSYTNDVKKYVRSSTHLQKVLKLEEKAAKEWHDIVIEIQDDWGKDLIELSDTFKDEEEAELYQAKEIFEILQTKAQNFLDILEETEPNVNNIKKIFSEVL